MNLPRIPTATYRVQLTQDFGFAEARAIVPYLRQLGISHLYVSPVFQARKGSPHGYDVTDPTRLNPELGDESDFDALVTELDRHGMGMILDIVPNHMAASPENPWWMDILENGAGSSYAAWFDISWDPMQRGSSEKVLLPILGAPYGTALENQELKLTYEESGFFVCYYQAKLPVDPGTWGGILGSALEGSDPDDLRVAALRNLRDDVERLPARTVTDWDMIERRHREALALKQRLSELTPFEAGCLRTAVERWNGTPGNPKSFDPLHQLLEAQSYHLAYWKVAREKINYRRFFDISDLVGVSVENMSVFEATHSLIFRLVESGAAHGLRVDHVDGLRNPREYLSRLQHKAPDVPIWVEKILLGDERLPQDWPVQGTTGYDFLAVMNAVFVDPAGWPKLDSLYREFTGLTVMLEDVMYHKKKRVAETLFDGEFLSLGLHLANLAEEDRYARDLSPRSLSEALLEVTACLPVYRTYIDVLHVTGRDRPPIEIAVSEARRRTPAPGQAVYDFLRRVLLLDFPEPASPERMETWLQFVMRWQQLTGPVMAKGVEDTTYYCFNWLVSLNEVGGNPTDMSRAAYHRFHQVRSREWLHSMNASSTHDTKRSEDVRARLNVLSELAGDWSGRVKRWSRWNRTKKTIVEGVPAPDANDEYMLYQTLLGAWPLDASEMPAFRDRMREFARKAVREAKDHSSWFSPNLPYEDALLKFLAAILADEPGNAFFPHIADFQQRTAFYGAINSLSQVVLKALTAGVPDHYQGTEMWDLSLVDPDNRRPVDYDRRRDALTAMPEANGFKEMLDNWRDGRIKLFVTRKSLCFRQTHAELAAQGEYLPLEVTGSRQEDVIALARHHGDDWAIALVPRFLARRTLLQRFPLGRRAWGDTAVTMPEGAPEHWMNEFTRERIVVSKSLPVRDALHQFPVAILSRA